MRPIGGCNGIARTPLVEGGMLGHGLSPQKLLSVRMLILTRRTAEGQDGGHGPRISIAVRASTVLDGPWTIAPALPEIGSLPGDYCLPFDIARRGPFVLGFLVG